MKLFLGAMLTTALICVPTFAQKKSTDERLQAATEALKALMNAQDKGIPQTLFDKASCVVVVPDLKKGGFIVGGEYGKGFVSCRKPSGVGWTAPGSVMVAGGKFGLLIGGAETDVVMLVMSKTGMEHLLSDKFQLGGEASAAAGPVGRDASAMTDAEMHAEILTYSRSRGIFGGIDLTGSTITEDEDSNRDLYGSKLKNKAIVSGNRPVPAAARGFIHTLDRISSRK